MPGFFLCLVGVLLFSVLLGWLPSQGMYEYGVFTGVGDVLRHLALPAGVVCVSGLGELVKQTRSACLESLGEDYILTARAKGLGGAGRHGAPRLPGGADPGAHHRAGAHPPTS